MITQEDLDNWFTYHAPKGDQVGRYENMRTSAKFFAEQVVALTPPGPDQDAAIRKLREVVMLANASIACHTE